MKFWKKYLEKRRVNKFTSAYNKLIAKGNGQWSTNIVLMNMERSTVIASVVGNAQPIIALKVGKLNSGISEEDKSAVERMGKEALDVCVNILAQDKTMRPQFNSAVSELSKEIYTKKLEEKKNTVKTLKIVGED